VVAVVLATAFAGAGMPPLPLGEPAPADDEESALAALETMQDAEGPDIDAPCRTQLLRPQTPARGTVIVWHGFTNCPAQFAEVAEVLCSEGYFVLTPRLPRHGDHDKLTRDLEHITADEIIRFMHSCVDVAAGLPGPVYAVGLSVGGSLTALAGALRTEVLRIVVISPLVEPKSVPTSLGRVLVRFRRFVPGMWIWWDPRKKENLGETPYVYPGFPLPGLIPFLHIGESLLDGKTTPVHRLERAVLISNPGDFAIRRDVARKMFERAFTARGDRVLEFTLDKGLGWWHDFVDQHGPHHGTPEQVADLVLAALGVSADETASGVVASVRDINAETNL